MLRISRCHPQYESHSHYHIMGDPGTHRDPQTGEFECAKPAKNLPFKWMISPSKCWWFGDGLHWVIEWIPLLSNLFCSVFQFCPITAVATSIPSLCPKLHSSQVDVNLQLPGFFENMKIILLDHDTFGSLRGSTVGNPICFNGKMLLRKSSMVDIPMLSGTDYQATVGQKKAQL